jgi:hypothetical protein
MSVEEIANSILSDLFTAQYMAVAAVMLYFYNVDPREQARALFPCAVDAYIDEWVGRYRQGLPEFWGLMDKPTQRRYVQLALDRYSAEL